VRAALHEGHIVAIADKRTAASTDLLGGFALDMHDAPAVPETLAWVKSRHLRKLRRS
jgi:hypothetical protein